MNDNKPVCIYCLKTVTLGRCFTYRNPDASPFYAHKACRGEVLKRGQK